MPSSLRATLEDQSGIDLSNVQVHRNSPEPPKLAALAFARGNDIHLGPRQEMHLPHEARHIVQQKQGRVKPNLHVAGLPVNDDPVLEREADAGPVQRVRLPDSRLTDQGLRRLTHDRLGLQTVIPANPPLQAKWDYVDDNLMEWDAVLGGLKWYYSTDSGLMSFQIEEGADAPHLDELRQYQGHARPWQDWLDIWRENGWAGGPGGQPEARGGQAFGADLPKDRHETPYGEIATDKPRPEKLGILERALSAGNRVFDTAETYHSTDVLLEAAANVGVPARDLKLISKIKPEAEDEDARLSPTAKLAGFRQRLRIQMSQIPGSTERVLMLHDLPENKEAATAYLSVLYEEAAAGEAGKVVSLGLSNVKLDELRSLYYYADEHLMKVRFVQNRFTPYDQDDEVRNFCAANEITYMGFGILGGAGLGECKQGYGMPQQQLQVLQDARFKEIARVAGMDPALLLLAWASQKGVTTVVYSGNHAEENLRAQHTKLSAELMKAIDALFKPTSDQAAKHADDPLAPLYNAVKQPAAWHILDTLLKGPHARPEVRKMFMALVASIVEQYPASAREEKSQPKRTPLELALQNVVLKLMRFVTHLQVLAKSGKFGYEDWYKNLRDIFGGVANSRAGDKELIRGLLDWTQRDYTEIGGAAHASEPLEDLALQSAPEPRTFALAASSSADSEITEMHAFKVLAAFEDHYPDARHPYPRAGVWKFASSVVAPSLRVPDSQKEKFEKILSQSGYLKD